MAPRSDLDTLPAQGLRARRAHEVLLSRGLEGTAVSAVRVVIGFFLACHGAQKLFGVVGGVDGHGAVVATGSWPGWWAGLIELGGGALVLVGLLSRPAAILCSGEMAFAYFTVHQPHAALPVQNHGELAALFSWSFLLIALVGPGWFSLDALVRTARHRR